MVVEEVCRERKRVDDGSRDQGGRDRSENDGAAA
jgi:hypothetical protein